MIPNAFYRHHHQVEAPAIDEHRFRPFWRRRLRLDDLRARGSISDLEYRCAVEFRERVERAEACGFVVSSVTGPGAAGDRSAALARAIDAATAIRTTRTALGDRLFWFCTFLRSRICLGPQLAGAGGSIRKPREPACCSRSAGSPPETSHE